MPDAVVRCLQVSKTYSAPGGVVEALHEVDAEFAGGELSVVVGASGSGKSTLLRAIAGLDRPTSGRIETHRLDLAAASPGMLREHRERHVTYVSQRAADNFVPHLRLRDQPGASNEEALALFESFAVRHRLGSLPRELSGGEQARAAFALALARETQIVISDEPTAELDRDAATRLLEAIHAHIDDGVAFVVATHDHDVIQLADNALTLDHGRRVLDEQASLGTDSESHPTRPNGRVVLETESLAKSFRLDGETVHALRAASIELRESDLSIVLGRSGSGKSTLLSLLGAWQQPDSGAIRYALPHDSTPPRWGDLALLPQRFGLLPELTVRQNIELPIRLNPDNSLNPENTDALLERLGLTDLAGRLPSETSIGQQQRIALARALILRPAILLADEPTSHQDAGWREMVWQTLAEATNRGTACLVATHDETVSRHATNIWRIEDGETAAVR